MMSTEAFIEKARAKHGDRFDYSTSRYAAFKEPIEVVCRTHGPCQTTPKAHLHSRSGGCVECRAVIISREHRFTNAEFIERARKVHGDRYQYHLVDYDHGRAKVVIVCPKHGPFQMKAARHIEGRGCQKCAFERIGRERRLSFWDFVERVVLVHGAGRYDYEMKDFVNAHSKIPIRCPKHGVFRQTPAAHMRGHGCPRCVQSAGEQRVREALSTLGVDFSEQVRFADCCDRRPLAFDFYVPEVRLLIEFDGRQHYDNSELWGGDEQLAETQRHDAIKDRFAARNGYRLLRIPYWEADRIEDILLERLTQQEV